MVVGSSFGHFMSRFYNVLIHSTQIYLIVYNQFAKLNYIYNYRLFTIEEKISVFPNVQPLALVYDITTENHTGRRPN